MGFGGFGTTKVRFLSFPFFRFLGPSFFGYLFFVTDALRFAFQFFCLFRTTNIKMQVMRKWRRKEVGDNTWIGESGTGLIEGIVFWKIELTDFFNLLLFSQLTVAEVSIVLWTRSEGLHAICFCLPKKKQCCSSCFYSEIDFSLSSFHSFLILVRVYSKATFFFKLNLRGWMMKWIASD